MQAHTRGVEIMNITTFKAVIAGGKCGGKVLMLCTSGELEFDIVTSGNPTEIIDEMLDGNEIRCGLYDITGDYCVEPRDQNGQSTSEFKNIKVVKINE